MLCPWCLHYGAHDDEYIFDDDLVCGICAQQVPRTPRGWQEAFAVSDPAWIEEIERELNAIISSRSGLPPEMREAIGAAVDAFRDRRVERTPLPMTEAEYADWFRFACTYFAPS